MISHLNRHLNRHLNFKNQTKFEFRFDQKFNSDLDQTIWVESDETSQALQIGNQTSSSNCMQIGGDCFSMKSMPHESCRAILKFYNL